MHCRYLVQYHLGPQIALLLTIPQKFNQMTHAANDACDAKLKIINDFMCLLITTVGGRTVL